MPHGTFQQFWGRGMRFCSYYASEHDLYWIAVVNAPEGGTDSTGHVREALAERFRDWSEPIPTLIDATEEQAILRTDIADLRPLTVWGRGRVTLLGDAAHAMTFNVGQGACTAIEDAVVLARWLGQSSDVDAALRAYEAERIKRTRTQQRLARTIGAMGRWENPVVAECRDQLWHTAINLAGPRLLERGLSYEA
jgi:2-polyprenyl-6-methoxyphenol hydroxylase-like FAD-dependent oxidoreductase